MTIESRRRLGGYAAGVGLLAVTALVGLLPPRAAAAEKAEAIVAGWPEPSRRAALAMIDKHGQPDRRREGSLAWYGLYRGRRTVVHRSETGADAVEQVVVYRVPAEKAGAVALFDPRIKVNRRFSELSARTDGVRTSFLLLNLAHEVASGFKTVAEAQAFRDRQVRLAAAGKSSRYRDGLIFEKP